MTTYNHRYRLIDFKNDIDHIRDNGFKLSAVSLLNDIRWFVTENEKETQLADHYFNFVKPRLIDGSFIDKKLFLEKVAAYEESIPAQQVRIYWL